MLFAIRPAAHVVYIVPFHAVFYIDQVVNDGEYDRYLLRPVNTFVQLITRRFPAMAMGDVVLGETGLPALLGWLSPVVGALIFVGGHLLHRRLSRHYASPGG